MSTDPKNNLFKAGEVVLTIIIPTYNCEVYIADALKTIVGQKFQLFEVLIIDNLSTDSTTEIIKESFGHDERIKIYRGKDGGIYEAMNKGIALAKGKWIYFMGADDGFVNNDVLTKVSHLLNDQNDLVYGDVNLVPENIIQSGEWPYEKFIDWNINHQRIFYRRSLFEQYGNLNARYKIAADHELNIRFFCNNAIQKKYIPVTIANYHTGGFSARKTDEAFWKDWNKIIQQNFKPHLSKSKIYSSLHTYYKYKIDKKDYGQALAILIKVFANTFNLRFLKSMVAYSLNKRLKNAG